MKDFFNEEIRIINASKIDQNYLIDVLISEFDKDFSLKRNIQSKKIDIKDKVWLIYDPKIYIENNTELKK